MYSEITYQYLADLKKVQDEFDKIKEYARINHIPIMKSVVSDFLQSMVALKKPKNILEIGTAIGYSGSVMLKACNQSNLTTVELYQNSFDVAKQNFEMMRLSDRVNQILGDASQVVKELSGKYDLIFLDGAKGQYVRMLDDLYNLLETDGVLIADNVLFRGQISGEVPVVRRKKTIVKRMQNFLEVISNDKRFITSILPIDDGVSVCVRI